MTHWISNEKSADHIDGKVHNWFLPRESRLLFGKVHLTIWNYCKTLISRSPFSLVKLEDGRKHRENESNLDSGLPRRVGLFSHYMRQAWLSILRHYRSAATRTSFYSSHYTWLIGMLSFFGKQKWELDCCLGESGNSDDFDLILDWDACFPKRPILWIFLGRLPSCHFWLPRLPKTYHFSIRKTCFPEPEPEYEESILTTALYGMAYGASATNQCVSSHYPSELNNTNTRITSRNKRNECFLRNRERIHGASNGEYETEEEYLDSLSQIRIQKCNIWWKCYEEPQILPTEVRKILDYFRHLDFTLLYFTLQ